MPTKTAALRRPKTDEVIYPSSDGEPMAETGLHVMLMVTLIPTLRYFFRRRRSVYVIGNIFFYYEEGNSNARRAPDVMVIKGAQPRDEERTSWLLWEEGGIVPSVIFELTSMKTMDEDIGPKRRLYERLKVREYFLFDPLRHLMADPLSGYRLAGDKYEVLRPVREGGLVSKELGLRLVPEGTELALFSLKTGKRIPTPAEAYTALEQAQRENELLRQELARLKGQTP